MSLPVGSDWLAIERLVGSDETAEHVDASTGRREGPIEGHGGGASLTRVLSGDGTEIGYWTNGDGPPLVLVHGTPADHTRWSPLLPYLEGHATVHAMDRRGCGASGDGPGYDVAREYEDLATVVDAIAASSRTTVDGDIEGVAAALPDARIAVIDGQQHVGDVLVPEIFADVLLAFLDHER